MNNVDFIEELDEIEEKVDDPIFYWSDLPAIRKALMSLILILAVSVSVFRFFYIYTDRPGTVVFFVVSLMFSYFLYRPLCIKNKQFAYGFFFAFLIFFIKITVEFFFYNGNGIANLMLLMGFAYLLSVITPRIIRKISKPETKQLVFAVFIIVFYIATSFTSVVARVKKLQNIEMDGVEKIAIYKPQNNDSWKPSSKIIFKTEDKVFIMKVIDMMRKIRPYAYDRGESIKDPYLMCFFRNKNDKGFCVRIGKGTTFFNNAVRIDPTETSAYVSFELYDERKTLFLDN